MRSRSVVPAWLLAFGLLPAAGWGDGPAVGDEFQVNSYTTSFQTLPAVGLAPDGGFVVVWESYGSPGSDTAFGSVQGQRYAADGTPLGGQFQVNSYTASYQYVPAVAAGPDGAFVVAWESYGSDGSDTAGYGIQAQRYAADGLPLGGQFQVNSYTTAGQYVPAVAVGLDGAFVVVWHSEGSSGSDTGDSVQAQRYASDGAPLGGEFQVNSFTTSSQSAPAVGVAPDSGAFVVVWHSDGSSDTDTDGFSIQGQRYAADGTPLGGEFQINSYTTLAQMLPSVDVAPGGAFVVVWESEGSSGSDTEGESIQGQRYASDGTPLGGEFQVNSYTTSSQALAAVSVAPGGAFVVTWISLGSAGSDISGSSIQGQRYASDGTPLGGQFQVNSYTTSAQLFPAVGAGPGGAFVVVWDSYGSSGSDTDAFSVQGQRFSPMIFADGFESGDTSAWSATVP